MASVLLDFIPPNDEDIVKLYIYEAPDQAGPFVLIETVTEVGEFPDYLSHYTTQLAASLNGWFQIGWENSGGARSARSNAIQGGTSTAVGEIVERVMQRNSAADEGVVTHVAEAVIEEVLHTDPYEVNFDDLSYRQKEGLTLLTLAYSQIAESASSGTVKYTAGLVSEEIKDDAGVNKELLNLAYKWLGISKSRIAQMEEIAVVGGLTKVEKDQSRLLLSEFA